jgi:hypothetical protein
MSPIARLIEIVFSKMDFLCSFIGKFTRKVFPLNQEIIFNW